MGGYLAQLGEIKEGCLEEVRLDWVLKVELKEARWTKMEKLFPAERMTDAKIWRQGSARNM